MLTTDSIQLPKAGVTHPQDAKTLAVISRLSDHDHRRRALARGPLPEAHLCETQARLGRLAEVIQSHAPAKGPALRAHLEAIAAYGWGWLETLAGADADFATAVVVERGRQRQLFREHRWPVQCESAVIDPLRKLRLVVEQLGEVAAAIDLLEAATASETPQRRDEFQARLIELIATGLAWLESLAAGPHDNRTN